MKPKSILFAVALALVATLTTTAFAVEERHADTKAGPGKTVGADKIEAKNTLKNDGHTEEKAHTPTDGFKLDFKELFGCMPMEEKTHMPPPESAPEESKPEPMKPMQEK